MEPPEIISHVNATLHAWEVRSSQTVRIEEGLV